MDVFTAESGRADYGCAALVYSTTQSWFQNMSPLGSSAGSITVYRRFGSSSTIESSPNPKVALQDVFALPSDLDREQDAYLRIWIEAVRFPDLEKPQDRKEVATLQKPQL